MAKIPTQNAAAPASAGSKLGMGALAMKMMCMQAGLTRKEQIALHLAKARIGAAIIKLYKTLPEERADVLVAAAMKESVDQWQATHHLLPPGLVRHN